MNRFEDTAWVATADEDTLAGACRTRETSTYAVSEPVSQTACGKAIVVGEHAVVYGARAIAMPLTSMRVAVRVRQRATGKSIRLFLDGKSVSDHLSGVVEDALRLLDMPPLALDIEGNSGVLIGAGLGSSASLCIVMLRALAELSGQTLTTEMLAHFGNQLEGRFHGNPSGLDTAVVAHEHVIAFRRGEGGRALQLGFAESTGCREPWPFVLIDSGLRSSTVAMINVARPYFTGSQGETHVARFDAIAGVVENALAQGDRGVVGEAMTETHHLLREAGVVNARLDAIFDACRDIGTMGAKVTGAGGGGCLLALLDPASAGAQLSALRNKLGTRHVYSVRLNG